MALPSALSSQAGFAIESTYGVWATPTTFVPMLPGESVSGDVDRIESDAVLAGRSIITSDQWAPGMVKVGGDTPFELYDRNMGKLFRLLFGTYATTGSGPYTHTFSANPTNLLASASWQFGRPDNAGTVHPWNYTGMKIASAEIGCKVGEFATFNPTWVGRDELAGSRVVTDGVTTNGSAAITSATAVFTDADRGKLIGGSAGITTGTTILSVQSATAATLSANATATGTGITFTIGAPLATASYAADQVPFVFTGAALTIGGSNAYAQEATIKIDNGLADERGYLGSNLTREQLQATRRTITTDIKAEFDGLASWTAFRAGTEAALVFSFSTPDASSTATITQNVRYDSAKTNTPAGVLEKDITVKAVAPSTTDASACSAVLVNSDSAL